MSWNGIVKAYSSCADMAAGWEVGHYVVGHPTVRRLETVMAEMLSLPVATTNRGMTAIMAAILALTKAGDTIVCSQAIYPGTRIWLKEMESQERINVVWWNPTDYEELQKFFDSPQRHLAPRLIFVETIGNAPSMPVADMARLNCLAQEQGALVVVDTTFTPLWRSPESGNMVVVGSMTKYHGYGDDLMGGYIAARSKVLKRVTATRFYQDVVMLPSVAQAFRDQVGGLYDRYRGHSANAYAAASVMKKHPAVAEVFYPGLPARRDDSAVMQICWRVGAVGAVFFARMKGGEAAAIKLADALANRGDWELAVSFGSGRWRVFPFVGELAQHVGAQGIVRISAGYDSLGELAAPNLAVLKSALDALLS